MSARILRHSSRPVRPGIIQSLITTSGRSAWNASQASAPSVDGVALVAEVAQRDLGDEPRGRVVVGDEDLHDASAGESRADRTRPSSASIASSSGSPPSVAGRAVGRERGAEPCQLGRAEVGARSGQRVGRSLTASASFSARAPRRSTMRISASVRKEPGELPHQVLARGLPEALEALDDARIEHGRPPPSLSHRPATRARSASLPPVSRVVASIPAARQRSPSSRPPGHRDDRGVPGGPSRAGFRPWPRNRPSRACDSPSGPRRTAARLLPARRRRRRARCRRDSRR